MIPKSVVKGIAAQLADEKVDTVPDPTNNKRKVRVVSLAPVGRREFERECPPVELRLDVITEPLIDDPEDEIGFRRSRRAASQLTRRTSDMREDLHARLTWLAMRSDTAEHLRVRLERVDELEEPGRDDEEHPEAIWPTPHARNRWRATVRAVREFNDARDRIAALL